MADSNGPRSAAPPVAGQPAPAASGGPAAIDPVAVIRSRPYIAALALAAILGIPISAIAYGFLALVAAIQQLLFSELPNQIFGRLSQQRRHTQRQRRRSYDLYFGPTAPEGRESNWVETSLASPGSRSSVSADPGSTEPGDSTSSNRSPELAKRDRPNIGMTA